MMKRFLMILVFGLLFSGNVYAGSFVGTKWEITSIPIESNNRPYTIEFLKGGKCKFKQDKPDSDIDIRCVWKKIDEELFYTINDYSFLEAIISGKKMRGTGYNKKGYKWKLIGERID